MITPLSCMRAIVASMVVVGTAHATVIAPNTVLVAGQSVVTSENGRYSLVMQDDGNLVLYGVNRDVRFATFQKGSYAVMQGDGNFVEYGPQREVWSTGTAGNAGAYLAVQDDGNLVLYNQAGKPLWQIGVDLQFDDPTRPGDVVARELDYRGLGDLGHIGVWDGERVFQTTREAMASGNALEYVSMKDFRNASRYWGKASPNIPDYDVYYCFGQRCDNSALEPDGHVSKTRTRDAIRRRALQAYLIGADYTLFPQYTPARAADSAGPARRGTYRCDTLVLDMLGVTVHNDNARFGAPVDATWASRHRSLTDGTVWPVTMFNRLTTFN